MAVGVVNYAARRSLALERKEDKQEGAETTVTLGGAHAVLIPVLSSVSLLVIFYFFSVVQQLVRNATLSSPLPLPSSVCPSTWNDAVVVFFPGMTE
jgi:hypothetical protein